MRRLAPLQVRSSLVIDLHQLNRSSVDLNEGDDYAAAGAVRLNDDVVAGQRRLQIVNLECDVRHRLDQVWIRRAIPVPLPLNAEGIALMIAHGHLKVRQRNLAGKPELRGDSDMVELHLPASSWPACRCTADSPPS